MNARMKVIDNLPAPAASASGDGGARVRSSSQSSSDPGGAPPDSLIDAYRSLVDEVEAADRAIASATAARADAIDRLRRCNDAMAEIDARDDTESHGWDAKTRAERELLFELVGLLRIPENTARTLLWESGFLVGELPGTIAALREGAISYQHARVIIDAASSVAAEALTEFEDALLAPAKELTVAQFKKVANRQREKSHPESITERHEKAVRQRAVWLEPADDGMAVVGARLAAEQAHAIYDRLTHIGLDQPRGDDDERTLSQKRADAFADLLLVGDTCAATAESASEGTADGMAEGSGDRTAAGTGTGTGAGAPRSNVGHGIRPRVLVTVPVMTLLGHSQEPGNLEGYGPIDPDTARDLASHAPSFSRILVHPVTSAILDYDRTTYAVPSDLRTVLRVRDEKCRAIGCNRAAENCDVDHTEDWALGGATALTNLANLCSPHHRVKTHTRVKMRNLPNGDIEWTAPSGRVYATHPANVVPGVKAV